jgi:hypothetical protein
MSYTSKQEEKRRLAKKLSEMPKTNGPYSFFSYFHGRYYYDDDKQRVVRYYSSDLSRWFKRYSNRKTRRLVNARLRSVSDYETQNYRPAYKEDVEDSWNFD